MDNKIPLQSYNARNRQASEGIVDARLRLSRNNDSEGAYRRRSCASFVVVPAEYVSLKDSAVFGGQEFTDIAR
jgi:hypothetical protein